jgi:hypothetical protein
LSKAANYSGLSAIFSAPDRNSSPQQAAVCNKIKSFEICAPADEKNRKIDLRTDQMMWLAVGTIHL